MANDEITQFNPPPTESNEDKRTYKAYVEYLRKKHYGEPIRAWEPREELFKNKNKNI